MSNKAKGAVVFILGIVWIIFVCSFDFLMRKAQGFGLKAGICFLLGAVMLVNGIRILRRK